MIRNFLLLPFLCLAIAAQAQYSEPFSVPSKGYKINFIDDLTAVNWSLSAWDQPSGNRDAGDYFNTTAAGKLECIDLDQEVFWESPLINTVAANPVSIKMDLSWVEFDTDVAANNCSTDYIKVEYSVNGGAYVMIPNVAGGNACATVAYPFQNPGGQFSGNVMINHGGVAGGSTLKIRIKVKTNANLELVTIDNVEVPEAGVNVGCAAPSLSTVVTPVGCSNPNSGAIDLTVSAGTPPYTYSWTGGATTQDISGKPTGTYTVTVTDAASCSATISATIGNAPTLTLTTLVLDASCNGNMDGEVSLDVTGGVPGYTYDWSNDGPENPDNDPQDLVGLGTGTYTVTVTDASGCSATKSATVGILPSGAYLEQFNIANKGYLANYVDDFAGVNWTMGSWAPAPPAPFGREVNDYFRTSGGALVGIDFDQEICWTSPLIDLNGGTQFSVDLSWVTFDQEDYINVNYSIDGGAFVQVPNVVGGGTGTIDYPVPTLDQSGSVTVTKTGFSGGTIQIQVCGNFNTETMTVDNVNIPGSNNYCPAPEPSLTGTNVSCNGGSNGTITTTVTNGTAPYTYAWSDGGVTTQNRTGLAAGTYTVTVTDANMATGTASIQITQPTAIVLTETHVNVLCNGASTGSIDLTVSGGTGAYTYSWTGGVTTQDRSGLVAGTYTVTVTDANACTKTLSVTITQPAAIVLTETHTNVVCNGQSNGTIDLTVTGGTGAYTYSWTGGSTTQDRSGLIAGTYTVTVTDANACTKTLSTTITQPNSITVSSIDINVPCLGDATGGFNITVFGGTPGYTYDWSNNGPQNPDTDSEDLMNVVAGIYTVSITDANGCQGFFGDTVKQPATLLALSTTQVNVQCTGNSTGSIDLTVTGGGSPYTYSWTGGATTQDRSGLAAGTYTVTVTDANNCVKTISATITEPSNGLSLTETHVNVLCNGGSTGSIDLTVSGGVSPYTYSWTGGATTQDRSGLAAGTYTVTVTDANSCTRTLSTTITQPATIALTETHVNVLCNGGSTGSIDLTVTGGTSPYTYSWTGGATTQDRSGLAAGTYTVTVTDNNACTKTLSATITEPTNIVLTETHVNVLCQGSSTGSIDLTVSGGVSPYTYSWTGGATTQDRSGLAAGTYTVTVTDANACTKTLSATITEPAAGITLTETHVNVLCNGNSTGSIDLTPSGGTTPYTYSWTGGATTQDRLNLAAGTYTVTVTDVNGCTKTLSTTITEPTNIVLTETHVNVLCNGSSTGSIDLTVSGGISPYTYSWTGGATTQDRSGLAAGTYTVTVTDANACTKTLSTTITEPTNIVLTETHVNVLCNGASTGSIDLTVSGGVSPYTYSWTGGATTQDRSGLAAGTYTVTVTDANACTKTLSATITEPAAGITLIETHVNVLCNGNSTGSIDLTPSGGTTPYTYSWTGGATTQDRLNLAAGTYTVTVTDVNGCTKTLSATITEPTNIVLTETHVNALCNGNSTGSIDLTVSGGVSPYTYSWTGGATTQDRSGLAAGTYTVTVTDANACTKTLSATITEPTNIVLTETHVNVLCNGNSTGSIDLTVSGGVSPYTYSWTGGATTQDRSGLAAGTYTVTVTDANACTKTLSTTITEASTVVLTETHVNVLCNGASTGSIDLTVSGGVSPYTYSWTGGATTQDRSGLAAGTYTVTVTDANACTKTLSATITETTALVLTETHVNVLCNGSSTGSIDLTVSGGTSPYTYSWTGGATTQDRSGLAADTYTVTVTDANACTKTLSATITQPTAIVLSTTQVNVLCNGNSTGSIDLTVSGGTGAYTYSWTGGVTTQDRSGLAAGTYTVTVTDANVCTKTLSATITEPATLVLTETHVDVLCNGALTGSIDLTVTGGVSPYTYLWAGGATTQDRSGLGFGTYTVTVTDANACTKTLSVSITETSPLVLTETHVNVLCNGSATGSIDLTVSGGSSPYTYSWTGGATTQDRSGLVVGTYTVTVTDANNCTKTLSATITEPTVVVLSTTQVNVLCNGSSTGSIDLTVSGGVPAYTYSWTGGATTQDVSGLAAGTYTVTVTDANACTKTSSVTITQPTAIVLSAILTQPTNCFVANGSIDLSVSGGVPGYTYSWTGGVTTQDLLNVVEATYTVTVTDANGCTKTSSYTLDYIDIINPTITCPASISVNNNPASACSAVVNYSTPTATDNCGILSVTLQSGLASGATYPVGTTTNVWRATDLSNNTATCSFSVTVTDVTLPSITCPANISVNNSPASACSAVVNYTTPTATDNCGIQSVTLQSGLASGATFPVGTTINVWRATDVNAKTSTCSFTVTVNDVTPPTVTCKNYTADLNASGNVSIVPANVLQTGSDNCGTVNYAVNPNSFSCSNVGTNTVTLTARDASFNTATCTATVTVRDVTPPVARCKTGIINADLGPSGTVTLDPLTINNGSTDNCSITFTLMPNPFNCSQIGLQTVTLKATDPGGNMSTCTATVRVRDVTGPMALCKTTTVFLDDNGMATITPAAVNNGSSDNCGIAIMSVFPNNFDCSQISGSPVPVTLSVRDNQGYESRCTGYVIVKDAIAPTAVCEDVTIAIGPNGYAVVYGEDLAFNSTDNCSVWSYLPYAKVYTAANLGNNNLTVTVKDWSGNAATCVSVVTVILPGNGDFQQGGDGGKGVSHGTFDLLIYPNPTSGEATMAFELPAAQAFSFRIFDVSGRMIYHREDIGLEGENVMPLDLNGLAPGIYLIDFQSENWKVQKRLVISR